MENPLKKVGEVIEHVFRHPGSKLKVYEQDGKFGVGESAEFVPTYSFDTKAEAEEYIKQHGAEVELENGDK